MLISNLSGWVGGWVVGLIGNITTSAPNWGWGLGLSLAIFPFKEILSLKCFEASNSNYYG